MKKLIYTGRKKDRLAFKNILTNESVSWKEYDIDNYYHSVDTSKYKFNINNLQNHYPEDFEKSRIHITEDQVFPGAGITEYACICLEDPDFDRIAGKVEDKLSSLGYQVDNTFGNETKKSLAKFQIKTEMPIGFLDHGTLDLLGVEY